MRYADALPYCALIDLFWVDEAMSDIYYKTSVTESHTLFSRCAMHSFLKRNQLLCPHGPWPQYVDASGWNM
jgi:hypothetical protein